MKQKWIEIVEKYGKIAVILYFIIFFVSLFSFFALLEFGFSERILEWFGASISAEKLSAGNMVLAYALTKITQPIRILITVLCLPLTEKIIPPKKENT